MKEYALLFRKIDLEDRNVEPENRSALVKKWIDWTNEIIAQGKLSSRGNRLSVEGKVLKPGGILTDGPFVEIKEKLGGFVVVKAESLDEATTLAHGCPVLEVGGSVEIRPVFE